MSLHVEGVQLEIMGIDHGMVDDGGYLFTSIALGR